MDLLIPKPNACRNAWQRVWDMVEVCSTGRAQGHVAHIPPHDGVTLLQAAPQDDLGCTAVGEGHSVLGVAWGATRRTCGMPFTTQVKPCLLQWEEGTGPGAKMSVTLLRSCL